MGTIQAKIIHRNDLLDSHEIFLNHNDCFAEFLLGNFFSAKSIFISNLCWIMIFLCDVYLQKSGEFRVSVGDVL